MPSDLTNGNTLACGGLDLTAEGTALHQSLRDYIAIPRERLLGQFDEGTSRRRASARRLAGLAPNAAGEGAQQVRSERDAERGVHVAFVLVDVRASDHRIARRAAAEETREVD